MLSPFYLVKNTQFEKEWYANGYRSVVSPLAIPKGSTVKAEYEKLQQAIQHLILNDILPRDAIHYYNDIKEPAILFKFSWVEMCAIVNRYYEGSTSIDTSKPGHAQDTMRLTSPWRLTNILADKHKQLEIKQALEATAKVNGQFKKIKGFDLPKSPMSLAGQEEILNSLLSKHQGLIFGEVHHDQAPKQFLMNHAAFLKKSGVEVIFLEHFCDTMQPSLDRLLETGVMSKALEAYVDQLNKTTMGIESSVQSNTHAHNLRYDFKELLLSMSRNKIKMVAIETTHSTVVKCGLYSKPEVRMAVLNHLFKLKYDQIITDNKTKWITLVGSAHMTTHYGVPGLSEIVNTPSVLLNQTQNQSFAFNVEPTDHDKAHAQVVFNLNVSQNVKRITPKDKPQNAGKSHPGLPNSIPFLNSTRRVLSLASLGLGFILACSAFSFISVFLLTGTFVVALFAQKYIKSPDIGSGGPSQDRTELKRTDTVVLELNNTVLFERDLFRSKSVSLRGDSSVSTTEEDLNSKPAIKAHHS